MAKNKTKKFRNRIICGDCLKEMQKIPDKSVDMILCDLPYGTTRNKWDCVIDLDKLWEQYVRIIKYNGAIVLTAVQIFASQLVMSKPDLFKYDLIWKKTIASGQLNVNRQPLRIHEHILVFYKKQPTYNQQLTKGSPYKINRKVNYKGEGYNKQTDSFKITIGACIITAAVNALGNYPLRLAPSGFICLVLLGIYQNAGLLDLRQPGRQS